MAPLIENRGVYYTDFMASLCRLRDVKRYLEIGVQNGFNLSNICCDTAVGVDPDYRINVDPTQNKKSLHLYRMTSDEFFRSDLASNVLDGPLDFAFLDGMHLFEYLIRDISRTEKLCGASAIIAIHDCLPFDDEMIERVLKPEGRTPGPFQAAWTGDVWKIIPILKRYRPDLRVIAVDCAYTGLVCLTNLDPNSNVLEEKYLEIVDEFAELANDGNGLQDFYKSISIVPADAIIQNFAHSLYFRS